MLFFFFYLTIQLSTEITLQIHRVILVTALKVLTSLILSLKRQKDTIVKNPEPTLI